MHMEPKTVVKDVTLRGIGFRDAADVSMEPWAVPSGGDWSIHRDAAFFVENAEDITVTDCRFVATGGNALLPHGGRSGI